MTILDKIVATKRDEIAASKAAVSEEELRSQLGNAPAVRDFFAPLAAAGPIKLIAEVKKASPSRGVLREDFDPIAIAKVYADRGASCISVLTDEAYFQGSLDYLRKIRSVVDVPLLRKDFILDTYQLVEARVAGADAVLLIAECLDDCQLRKLYRESIELEMTPLVEIYEPTNLARVLETGATLVGVNNRDLQTFEVDLGHCLRLHSQMPRETVMVAESGIHSRADVERLESAGVDAMLVGEGLIACDDIGKAVEELLGRHSTQS